MATLYINSQMLVEVNKPGHICVYINSIEKIWYEVYTLLEGI